MRAHTPHNACRGRLTLTALGQSHKSQGVTMKEKIVIGLGALLFLAAGDAAIANDEFAPAPGGLRCRSATCRSFRMVLTSLGLRF